jgi:integrase
MKAADFIKYLEETKSPSTVKIYKIGLNLFSEYYGKTSDQILEERKNDLASGDAIRRKRFLREIEKYHAWLMKEKQKPLNSATTYVHGILQLFRYFEMGVTIPSSSMVGKRKLSTKDFVPTTQQYRAMFRVADSLRDKVVISFGKDLGARIGDFVKITKDMIPDLDQEAPISFDLMTQKEDVLAKSFISEETAQLLKQYLPSLPEHNPYLFPSSNGSKSHLGEEAINRGLRKLAKKANVTIPTRKRLRFHAFRKRFISTCADLSIDINTAKILVGKNVEASMLAYLSEVRHKDSFIKVYRKIRLTEETKERKPIPTTELEKRVAELEEKSETQAKLLHGIIAVGGREYLEKAEELLKLERIPYMAEELAQENTLREVGTKRIEHKKKLTKEQLEEYRKLIENNNH